MSHEKSEETTKEWARQTCAATNGHGVNTKAKIKVENFDDLKKLFLVDIKGAVQMDEISAQLIVNWDQTGIKTMKSLSMWRLQEKMINDK